MNILKLHAICMGIMGGSITYLLIKLYVLKEEVRCLKERITGECDHEWVIRGPHDHHYTCTRCGKQE